jgi:hypothetical protein
LSATWLWENEPGWVQVKVFLAVHVFACREDGIRFCSGNPA